jgi:hypothetical protein
MKKVLSIMFICLATLSFAKTVTPSKTLLNNLHTVSVSIHTPENKLDDICTVDIAVSVSVGISATSASVTITAKNIPCGKVKETIKKLKKTALEALKANEMVIDPTFEETPEKLLLSPEELKELEDRLKNAKETILNL